jgi:hypothetical protein
MVATRTGKGIKVQPPERFVPAVPQAKGKAKSKTKTTTKSKSKKRTAPKRPGRKPAARRSQSPAPASPSGVSASFRQTMESRLKRTRQHMLEVKKHIDGSLDLLRRSMNVGEMSMTPAERSNYYEAFSICMEVLGPQVDRTPFTLRVFE